MNSRDQKPMTFQEAELLLPTDKVRDPTGLIRTVISTDAGRGVSRMVMCEPLIPGERPNTYPFHQLRPVRDHENVVSGTLVRDVEDLGLPAVLELIANIALENSKTPVPGSKVWATAALLIGKLAQTPAVVLTDNARKTG